jgi:sigma-B regulation protein RsbU (phosphoserine phosphatase)
LIETKNQLVRAQQREADELNQAAAYVRSLLPGPLTGDIRSDWQFETSSRLGGDLFGHHWLDDNRLAMYLLDVCGHGVGASLLSISVFDDLRRETLPVPDFGDPAAVLSALNRAFPMSAHGDRFTTVWYGVYDARARSLQYAAAGHPPAILVEPNGAGPVKLGAPGLPIGVAADASYQNATQAVHPAGRLYIYSDGVYEVSTADGQLLMIDGFVDILTACAGDGSSRTSCVRQQIQAICGGADFPDDFSLLEVEFP